MISPHRTLLKLIRRRRLHSDLEAELAYHRELAREHGNAVDLGNATAVKESPLDLWRFTFLETCGATCYLLLADYGATRLSRLRPCFRSLGIRVSSPMFAVLNAVAIRLLRYSNAEQLVRITQVI